MLSSTQLPPIKASWLLHKHLTKTNSPLFFFTPYHSASPIHKHTHTHHFRLVHLSFSYSIYFQNGNWITLFPCWSSPFGLTLSLFWRNTHLILHVLTIFFTLITINQSSIRCISLFLFLPWNSASITNSPNSSFNEWHHTFTLPWSKWLAQLDFPFLSSSSSSPFKPFNNSNNNNNNNLH